MSGAQAAPRMRTRLPLTLKRRPPVSVSSEVTSRMPKLREAESEVISPILTENFAGYRYGAPIWYGHQRCGSAILSSGNSPGEKRTTLDSLAASSTGCERETPGKFASNVTLTGWSVVLPSSAERVTSADL